MTSQSNHDFDLLETSYHHGLSQSFASSELLNRSQLSTSYSKKRRISSKVAQMKAVYGYHPSGRNQTFSAKSTIRLNATYTQSSSRNTTAAAGPRQSLKTDQTATPAPHKAVPTRYLEDLRCANATCKSDCYDLQRDVATYEHNFLQHTSVLPALKQLSEYIPEVINKAATVHTETERIYAHLYAAITGLRKSEYLYSDTFKQLPGSQFHPLNFELRYPSVHGKVKMLFKGVRVISEKKCFIQIHTNGWLTFFDVRALLLDGTMLTLHLDHAIAGLGSDLAKDECLKRVDQFILQRLYLSAQKDDLVLMHNPAYGSEFFEFPVRVQGYGFVSVQIVIESDGAKMRIPQIEEISTPLPVQLKKCKDWVSQWLRYKAEKSQFVWCDPALLFQTKEADSLLMDFSYVTEKLGINIHGASYITDIQICEHMFSVELHTRGGVEIVIIGADDKTVEVKEIEQLRALQFDQMRSSWVTVLRSLELQLCIKKLFPEHFTY